MTSRLWTRLGLQRGEHTAIARDFSVYSVANVASLLLLLGTGLVLRAHFGPYLAGVWTLLELLPLYAANGHLGVFSAAERELPYLIGSGDVDRFETVKTTVWRFAWMLAASLAVIDIVAALALRTRVADELFVGLLAYAGVIWTQVVGNYYIILLRARKRFVGLSAAQGIGTLIKAALVLSGGFTGGIYGVFGALAVASGVQLWLLRRVAGERFVASPNLALIRPLLRDGLPMLLGGLAFDTLRNADKIVIAAVLGAEALGVYSIAALVCQGLFYVPNAFALVLYPRLQERFGATRDPLALRRIVEVPFVILADGLLILTLVLFSLTPFLVSRVMPAEYSGALVPLRILLAGTYLVCLSQLPGQLLLTVRKQIQAMLLVAPAMVLAFVGCGYGARFGLSGVAIGAATALFTHFVTTSVYALSQILGARETVRVHARVLITAAAALGAVLFGESLIPLGELTTLADLGSRCAILTVVAAPLVWRLRARMPAIRGEGVE